MPKQVKARAAQDPQEERQVRKLAWSHHAPADWKGHAQMVQFSWVGKTPNEIAAELGCHPQTVRIHLKRFNAEGIAGLGMRPGSGRKPRLTGDEEGSAQWTLNALAQAAKEAGIRVKRSQIRRIYLREGVRWRHTHSWGDSSDPDARPKRTAVVTHYIKAPMDYSRGPEKTWVYGALRVRNGKELTRCAASRNSKGYIASLIDIATDNPTRDIFIITDNLSSHNSAETCAWLAEHTRIHHLFIPKGARLGSICKRAGGASSVAMRLRDRVLPNPMRLSRPRASRRLNSTGKPNRGSGVDRPKIIATIAISFRIAFKERSSRCREIGPSL
jgi:transposase